MRRAQIVTMDAVGGLLVAVLALGLIVAIILVLPSDERVRSRGEAELLYTFDNLQGALRDPRYAGLDFLRGYRVQETTAHAFANARGGESTDTLLLGGIGETYGVSLNETGYDTCLYFTDNDGSPVPLGTSQYRALGLLDTESCNERLIRGASLCDGYPHGLAVFRPVLWDTGSPARSRVIQMNVVACKV